MKLIDYKRHNAICDECGQWFHDPARPFRKWEMHRYNEAKGTQS